jgi:hypothetical protein
VAWDGHALVHQPFDFFQANTFWPLRNSLAFSDALAGYAPAGALGSGVEAAVVRYNLLFLLAYALCFVGAYLLARELGARPAGAAVAGAAFAYAPWRLEQDGHLHVISSGGIPLSLFLLVRGYRRGRGGLVLAGWLVATWQFMLGFTLGLQLAYLLAALAAVAFGAWLRRGRPPLPRRLAIATAAGAVVFALVAVTLARPYMQVLDDHPEAKRTAAQVSGLSGPAASFVAAPEQNLIWGKATHGARERLTSVPEQTLFPGLAIVALALGGALAGTYPRRLRISLAAAAVALAVLSLGFHRSHAYLYPYRLLYEVAPGWQGIRVPGRLMTLTSLALALLAATGAQRLVQRWREGGRLGGRTGGTVVAALLVAAIVVEGSGFDFGPGGLHGPSHPTVPRPPAGLASVPAPQLHLPLTVPASRRYVLWSTNGFPRIVNGRGSFVPTAFDRLIEPMARFPDERSVALARSLGVRSVVVHGELLTDEARRRMEQRPIARLPLRRSNAGELTVYSLEP